MPSKRQSGGYDINRGMRRIRAVGLAAVLGSVLGACSSVPDAANPAHWYRSVDDALFGPSEPSDTAMPPPESATTAAADGASGGAAGGAAEGPIVTYTPPAEAPGAGQPFPRLAEVPPRPVTRTSEERQSLQAALVADQLERRYSDEAIPLQGPSGDTPGTTMPASPPPPPALSSPPPSAVPDAPVAPLSDAPRFDAPVPDASMPDASMPDASVPSAPIPDAPIPDAPIPDAPIPDAPRSVGDVPPPPVAGDSYLPSPPLPTESYLPPAPDGPLEPADAPPAYVPPAYESPDGDVPSPTDGAPAFGSPGPDGSPPPSPATVEGRGTPSSTVTADQIGRSGRPQPNAVQSAFQEALRQQELAVAPAPEPLRGATAAPPPAWGASAGAAGRTVGRGPGGERIVSYSPTGAGADVPGVAYGVGGSGELIATIQFANGSAALSGNDRAILRQVARVWDGHGGTVYVIGHASADTGARDPAQSARVNQTVSERRARSVAAALAGYGVPRDRIIATGAGASLPRFIETRRTGEAGNRRAEILFVR